MGTKSFTDARKPGRQPTAEEIIAFEETGRAIARENAVARKAEARERRNAESREDGNTESKDDGDTDSRKPANTASMKGADTTALISANTEIRPEPIVRLTIDLPESAHTRFKAVCAITRRKMVEEVRIFIERRTAELESDAGLPR